MLYFVLHLYMNLQFLLLLLLLLYIFYKLNYTDYVLLACDNLQTLSKLQLFSHNPRQELFELELDHQYIMSPADICTIEVLDRILDAGVSILKIEGRGRPADYVAKTTAVYKEAVQAWQEDSFNAERAKGWLETLSTVFNRGFWKGGYYLGVETGVWSQQGGSLARERKTYLGRITNYYSKIGVAELTIETRTEIRNGSRVVIMGNTTGALETVIDELRLDCGTVASAAQGDVVSFKVPERVRTTDKVYLLEKTAHEEQTI